ncbi:MAG: 50S ribosomal protein L1 [Actinobacteria bacterium]|nr:50S ribosomal protein L1 [Actinomycetota bacterium]MCL6104043.1 50S ribosomal protein L1 [Actinomycetota bacterium]
MHRRGKKYRSALQDYDRERLYLLPEAVVLLKKLSNANFDETVVFAARLGVDPRKADQIVRGTISLPAGIGKKVCVAVFAAGQAAIEAREVGADIVGSDDLVARVEEGFVEFDVAIATPDLMNVVGKLGRILGPRGLMPNPRTGTVTNEVAKTVLEFKAGRIEYRTDKVGNVHLPVGKVSFEADKLLDNIRAIIEELQRVKPASAKGRYFRSLTLSSAMGPGIKIDPTQLRITMENVDSLTENAGLTA